MVRRRVKMGGAHENEPLLNTLSPDFPKTIIPFQQYLRLICISFFILSTVLTGGYLLSVYDSDTIIITPFDIYCEGPILHAIQMRRGIKQDGKDFVDRPMKYNPEYILRVFQALPETANLTEFLNKHFYPAGSDLLPVVPLDFQLTPEFPTIRNNSYKDWAIELNRLWKVLGRQPQLASNRHSYLPTKHMLIVPGGRFRESYYWDSYWIVHGLLACDMYDTARGIVENLLDFVETYGFVPNGGRIYYLTRSQPPLLCEMVRILHAHRPDRQFLAHATRLLDIEYAFWMGHQHTVDIQKHGQLYTLNRYLANTTKPRPESYREDTETARELANRDQIYTDLATAAETGWDFSSRWLKDFIHLNTVSTSAVIPVDLNCILHRMEQTLVQFYIELNQNPTKYQQASAARLQAIQAILYDEKDSTWKDYLFQQEIHSPVVSASNYFPLWSQSFDITDKTLIQKIIVSLEQSGLLEPGGIVTTTRDTGEQWDKPNAWPPIQDILIEGLIQVNSTQSKSLAKSLIQRWLHTNFQAWQQTGHMYEKYDASGMGKVGGGGEYEIQIGFGWSNGVILKFLTKYHAYYI